MKKLLAAVFAAVFATSTIGIAMLPSVAKAADKKEETKKVKKDKKAKKEKKQQ